jgi:hypothetical protein
MLGTFGVFWGDWILVKFYEILDRILGIFSQEYFLEFTLQPRSTKASLDELECFDYEFAFKQLSQGACNKQSKISKGRKLSGTNLPIQKIHKRHSKKRSKNKLSLTFSFNLK